MYNFLKKLFKNNIINNQIGSSMSITIIVIAVLAFSITSITKVTVNLSGSTTAELAAVNNESVGKGLITQSISEFEQYIVANNDYNSFNITEIPRLLSLYNVVVSDDTALFPNFGDLNGKVTKVYKFSYQLDNGGTLYKYAYMSNTGSAIDTFFPFEFSLATEGDLVLNGGYYDDLMMFGESIYVSKMSPWEENDLTYVGTTHYVSPTASGAYPTFTDNGNASKLFFRDEYKYCTSNCFTVTEDGSNPYIINKANYGDAIGSSLPDQGDVQTDNITSFFNGFNFEEFLVDYAANILPTDNRTITESLTLANFESVIRNNMDTITYRSNGRTVQSYPNTAYVDITNDTNYRFDNSDETLRFGAVYDGDLEFNRRVTMQDYQNEGFIVLGNLTINNDESGTDQRYRGTYIVTGDLIITGYSDDFNRATFIVLGETIIDYTYGYGLRTGSTNYELSILSKDNIRINGMWENYGTSSPSMFTILAYTEESIFIDAVSSKVIVEGAFFAKALGTSANPIYVEDNTGTQFKGIMINSFRGYVDLGYVFDYNIWDWVKDISYVPSSSDSANRFNITPVPFNQFQNNFFNIPSFEGVTVQDGVYTLETSEWKIE